MTIKPSIKKDSTGIIVTSPTGQKYPETYYVIDQRTVNGQEVFLLENEEYGDEDACIIVDGYNKVLMEDVWNGIDEYEEYVEQEQLEQESR